MNRVVHRRAVVTGLFCALTLCLAGSTLTSQSANFTSHAEELPRNQLIVKFREGFSSDKLPISVIALLGMKASQKLQDLPGTELITFLPGADLEKAKHLLSANPNILYTQFGFSQAAPVQHGR